MLQVFRQTTLAAIVLLAATPARSDELLKSIPADVAVVIRYQSIRQFLGGVNDMLTAIGPPASTQSEAFAKSLMSEFFELKGESKRIKRNVPAYAAVFGEDGPAAPVVWFVQVDSEQDLIRAMVGNPGRNKPKAGPGGFKVFPRNLRRNWYFRKVGKYYAYTQRETLAKKMTEVLDKKGKSVAIYSDRQAAGLMAASPVTVFLNSQGLTTRFKKEIDEGLKGIVTLIKSVPEDALGVADAKAAKKFYIDVIQGAFQSAYDAKWVVLQGLANADGGLGHATIRFKNGTKTKKLVDQIPEAQLDNLGLLPVGAPLYFGFELGLKGLAETITNLNYGTSNSKEAKAAAKLMTAGGLISQVVSFSFPKDKKTGFLATTLEEAKDAKKYLTGFLKFVPAIGEIKTPAFKQKVTYQGTKKHKNMDVHLLHTKVEITDANLQMFRGIFDKIFGGDTLQTRVSQVENVVISATGNDPKLIRNVVDNLKSGEKVSGLHDPFANAREKLGENANIVLLINAPQLVLDGINFVKDVAPFNLLLGQLPIDTTAKPPASYAGVALKRVKNGITISGYVPAAQPRFILKAFGPLFTN